MNLWTTILVALGGYLVGSISFTRIIGSQVAPDEDLSHTEVSFGDEGKSFSMKTVSATSLTFRKGPRVGCLTSFLDMLKAILPTLVIKLYYPEQAYFLIVAAAAMAGHNFPIYYRFEGGRGMSTLYGGLLVIDWLSIPVTVIGGALFGGLILRDMFFTYTVGIILLIPWLWYRFESIPYLIYGIVVNLLFWAAMIPEVQDYLEKKRAGLSEEVNLKKYWELAKSMWLRKKTEGGELDSEETTLQ